MVGIKYHLRFFNNIIPQIFVYVQSKTNIYIKNPFLTHCLPLPIIPAMASNLPILISSHFKELITLAAAKKNESAVNALKKQVEYSAQEEHVLSYESQDPLGSSHFLVAPRLVHQYKNRCLLLSTGRCFSNCRYCFRRASPAKSFDLISEQELEDVCDYILKHSYIEEILVSGGDIMTAPDDKIKQILQSLRKIHPSLLIRICTRAPVFAPERFTPELVTFFRSIKPLWLIPHINHSAELDAKTTACLERIIDTGIPVQSQTVLLKGVNDSVQELSKLFNHLVKIGVKPGYLFMTDIAPGTAHFRTPLPEALKLYEALKEELSGLSLPVFAVDIPDGGGKFNLQQISADFMKYTVTKEDNWFTFTDKNGKVRRYPIEKD